MGIARLHCISISEVPWLKLSVLQLPCICSFTIIPEDKRHQRLNNTTMATGILTDDKVNGGGKALSPAQLVQAEKDKHDIILKTFRILIADLCQQFNGGHPG